MSLSKGTRLGVYEIHTAIGEGGMGEVFRATDTRLNRDVAIKVLPAAFAADAERVSRFRREAQVLASLNHPNIAAIHGLEEASASDGQPQHALVMELVDGETLADRLAHGPLPLDDAIGIARQIAEAVEYAHDQGIIHRDLKPANIKIASSGAVKVLDFGLAKALDSGAARRSSPTDPAASPTLSLAATQAGLILGTAAYMSPEQAKGKPADRRADIWSFGIVLFEMLAGRPAYSGETISETMAHVITKEPEWLALPPNTPGPLRELLQRCLVKDPRTRLQAIGEARIALQQWLDRHDTAADAALSEGHTSPRPAASTRRRELLWASVAVLGLLATAAMLLRDRLEPPPMRERVRFEIGTPERGGPEYPQGDASLSPDGRNLAYVAVSQSRPLLWVHSFDTGTAEALESSTGIGPSVLTWSPDSRQIAFSVPGERRLKRVDVTGGPASVIAEVPPGGTTGGTWGAGGDILIGSAGRIFRVVAGGSEFTPVPTPDDGGHEAHRFPSFLPDGRHYFYLVALPDGAGSKAYIGAIDSPQRQELAGITSEVKYSSSGHILFVRDGVLMAQRFDSRRRVTDGNPFVVVDGLTSLGAVAGAFTSSSNGMLAYRPFRAVGEGQLTWLDRTGKSVGVVGPPGSYVDFELSPDERHLAYEAGQTQVTERTGDIWTLNLDNGVRSRITSDPARDADPIWSRDGKLIVFRSDRDGGHMYQRALGVVGDDALIFKGKTREEPDHWSPDGRFLIFTAVDDVFALPMNGDRKGSAGVAQQLAVGEQQPLPIATTRFQEREGRVSPDGRWIAYTSDESGRPEIYVQSFPKATLRQQVSATFGRNPRWSHDGRELYYVAPTDTLMAISVKATADGVNASAPTRLFQSPGLGTGEGEYAVASNGRFLINVPLNQRARPAITVVLNWAP